MDCTGINPQGCVLRPLSPDLDAGIVAKVGYVVRNIVGINNLLVEYYYGEFISPLTKFDIESS